MTTKQVIISSSGLKNVVLSNNLESNFVFIFGEQKFQMKSFFADFISPIVSNLHQTDPTINEINFKDVITAKNEVFNELSKTILKPEIISLLQQISSGFSIEINEEQAIKLRFLSIIIGNEELYNILNDLFPQKYSKENIDSYMKNIEFCYHFSQFKPGFDFASLLSYASSHFDELNKDDFLRLPRHLQHEIISHPDLQIESEDSLFDVVIEIIERSKGSEEADDILFLESIEFTRLSEDRLHTFFDVFDVNDMSGILWNKLIKCFFNHSNNYNTKHIIVSGANQYNQFGNISNKENMEGIPIISPPLEFSIDPSKISSISTIFDHTVMVTTDGSIFGIGDNENGSISSILTKTQISRLTEFSINDNSGHKLTPISAVCSINCTLYMFLKSSGNGRQLVYCDSDINDGKPKFLDIGNQYPVALFGGFHYTSAINDKGEILFIHRNSIKNSPRMQITAISLPDNEKASSIAFCNDFLFALSLNGRVYSSPVDEQNSNLRFSRVSELKDEEIVYLSGTWGHCLAVNKKGRVFGFGSNEDGQLGVGEKIKTLLSFTEISSLKEYKIKEAYAGSDHSLFVTYKGQIVSCGDNQFAELLLNTGPSIEKVYSPTETMITGGAKFCIAGGGTNVIFINTNPPKNMPNRQLNGKDLI